MTSRTTKLVREAWSALARSRSRTAFMIIAVIIGIAALTAVIAVGQGTRSKILGLVAKHGLDMGMVRAGGGKQVFAPTTDRGIVSLLEGDAAAIEAEVPNVSMVSPVQNQRGLETIHGDKSVGVRIFGVAPSWFEIRRRELARGQAVTEEDMLHQSKVAVVGWNTAKQFFGDADPVGQTIRIANDPFVVKGVFKEVGVAASGNEDWDDRIVIPFTTSSRRLFKRPYLEQIVFRVKEAGRMGETSERVRVLLRQRHQVPTPDQDDFFVREPKDIKEAALSSSSTLTRLLTAIAAVALLVSGIVIMNVMLLSVSQRTHEIGLRRALGARRGDILAQFLCETLLVTALGGAAGVALGLLVAAGLSLRGVAVAQVGWAPAAAAVAACMALALAFGLYPARRAVLVDPVLALREKRL